MKLSFIVAAGLLLAACVQSYSPQDVRNLSCDEIQNGLSSLNHERKALGLGAILGGIAVAAAAGPWVAVPVFLTPSLRGDRGEFALSVAEVLRGCE